MSFYQGQHVRITQQGINGYGREGYIVNRAEPWQVDTTTGDTFRVGSSDIAATGKGDKPKGRGIARIGKGGRRVWI